MLLFASLCKFVQLFSTLGYSYFVFIVTILGGITIEEPQPAPIETTYFTPSHLRVFKSGTIDFMQVYFSNQFSNL